MAKFINKKEEVIQMDLTAYGKHKFSRGEFTPAFYTFHDDDIMYDSGLGLKRGTEVRKYCSLHLKHWRKLRCYNKYFEHNL